MLGMDDVISAEPRVPTECGEKIIADRQTELAKCAGIINNVVSAVASGFHSAALRDKLHAAEQRSEQLAEEIKVLKKKQAITYTDDLLLKLLAHQEEKLSGTPEDQKELVDLFISKITVDDDSISIELSIYDNVRLLLVTLRGNGRLANSHKVAPMLHFSYAGSRG